MSIKHISKSNFITGLQCEKALYLKKFHSQLADEITLNKKNIFEVGTQVGLLAQDLFPGGVDSSPEDYSKISESIDYTKSLMQNGIEIIYEAAFEYEHVRCFVDILVKKENEWHIYEVKSSTHISETYINDVALQYFILRKCGLKVSGASVVHIDNSYVKSGDLEINKLFKIVSVLKKIQEKSDFIPLKLNDFKALLLEDNIPSMEIGKHCNKPYECDFKSYCWKHVPEYSVLNISRLKAETKWNLYNAGYLYVKDVPLETKLSSNQRIQVDCEINQTELFHKQKIREFLENLSNNVFHLDFETFGSAIPKFDGVKPFQHIPFQYSLHQEINGQIVKHYEFLADSNKDPREPFVKSLIKNLKTEGDILVYNIGFERGKLQDLIKSFPYYENDLTKIINRMKDLMLPFKEKWYYIPQMEGSYSIKKVLPALVPNLTYKDLSISKGDVASLEFLNLNKKPPKEVERIRGDLLEYCKMDTFAMFKILQFLRKKI